MQEYIGVFLSGFLGGLFVAFIVLKNTTLVRVSGEEYALRIPLIGEAFRVSLKEYNGVFTEEWLRLQRVLQVLKDKIDIEKMFFYADSYGIDYIGFDGDRSDGSWSSNKFAFCTMSRSHKRPFSIHINPTADREAVSRLLALQLNTTITPSDVYPFLFLHEVGHTSKAGNKNFFAAVINHTISGDRHSLSKRRELFRLKNSIEAFADKFALKELKNFR